VVGKDGELRILYVGSMKEGRTGLMRMRALRELGHEVDVVDTQVQGKEGMAEFRDRVCNRLGYPRDEAGVNGQIREQAVKGKYNLLWVDGLRLVNRITLMAVKQESPETFIVSIIMDDPFSKRSRGWRRFMRAVSEYDLHFVVREANKAELKGLGARHVKRFHKGFDVHTHRPPEENKWCPKREVFFAGHREPKREADIAYLIKQGIKVSVTGLWDWRKGRHWRVIGEHFLEGGVYGENYALAINSAKIGLCFYSKWNRDTENSKMYEIPACGTFMLAERNEENVYVFAEGKEAEYFGSQEELLDKVKYYLGHDQERERIAQAGRERCLKSGYSYQERLKQMLKQIEEM